MLKSTQFFLPHLLYFRKRKLLNNISHIVPFSFPSALRFRFTKPVPHRIHPAFPVWHWPARCQSPSNV